MGARYQFEMITPGDAVRLLKTRSYQAEMFRDAVFATRMLEPVTSAAERRDAAAYVPTPTYPCGACGRFAFVAPNARCFWCRERHV